jgi:glutamine synthetase
VTHREIDGLDEAVASFTEQGIDVVRLGYPDLLGSERGRDVLVSRFERTVGSGVAFCRSVFATSPAGDVIDIAGGMSDGLPDVVAYPDLKSVLPIPWEPGVAHCMVDIFNPDGTPSLLSPRAVLRRVIDACDSEGRRALVGPELEFFLLERNPASASGWSRYGDGTGNVYVTGYQGDPDSFLVRALRLLGAYGIETSAGNHEFSGGQFEINLWHSDPLDAADRAFRFKAAIKELARKEGKLATFMAKPFDDEGGSGFHLHMSAVDAEGTPLFDDPNGAHGISDLGRSAIAGVLAHAPALAALCNPTINSYKRFGPDTLAPWLIDWGLDNRSAMLRVPPERGRSTRMEVRLGDASANPYLAIAGVMAAAHLGMRNKIEAPAPLEGYGYDTSKAAMLPTCLDAALDALAADTEFSELLGTEFVEAFVAYKRNELDRFAHAVTDWEFREYAQLL